ncbi:MAG: SRPBCC domain-containing protein [Candidatus Elarobacter sp.]
MTRAPGAQRSDEPAFTITRTFDAPRELVFKLFTDPAYVAQWWGVDGSTNPVCALDVWPGGAWRIDMRTADGTVYPNGGVYLDVVENERIVSTDVPDPASPAWGGDPRGDALHTITFDEHDGKTTVTFHARFSSVADRDRLLKSGMREGIGQSFDRLERLMKRR